MTSNLRHRGHSILLWASLPLGAFFIAGIFFVLSRGSSPSARVSAVSSGDYYTCVLTSAGGVKCWGARYDGQPGDRITTSRSTPVDVAGLTSGVIAIAAGGDHTCALASVGGVKCWGDNSSGELGDGTTTSRSTPVDVAGLTSGVIAIAAGGDHTCALTSVGGVRCWGDNSNGELGDGTKADRLTPVDVRGLTSDVTAIALGSGHSCALVSDGSVRCWGHNVLSQLGDGSRVERRAPVDVKELTGGVKAISAGASSTCALMSGGGVKCWGYNVGDGTSVIRSTPFDVSGLTSSVSAISSGARSTHTCAVTSTSGVKCWGQNGYGELGDGTQATGETLVRLTPVEVTGLANGVTAVSVGHTHTCALTSTGGVKCWGSNAYGEVGDGTRIDRLTPVDVCGLFSHCGASAQVAAPPVPKTIQEVAEQFFPRIARGPMNGEFGASCYGSVPQFFAVAPPCPISDRLLKRFADIEAFLAADTRYEFGINNLLCQCQNISDTRAITAETTANGGIAHVTMFQKQIDLMIVRDGDKLLVNDVCSGNPSKSSVFAGPESTSFFDGAPCR